ncbi:MAG TPA: hypothetical protein PKK94_26245 [Leptospiraceae bacterium]|nr:hypothetical protein [Leptospiraceae bacterium]
MGYISNNLLSQETIQKEGKISIMVLVPHLYALNEPQDHKLA